MIERARLLSGSDSPHQVQPKDQLSLVEFSLAPERYAVEEQFVVEVLLLKELTIIPGAPDFVAGITNVRGRILSVLNLKIFLGIATRGITELNRIVLLRKGEMEFGILTDAILGSKLIRREQFAPPPVNLAGTSANYVKGVTADGLVLLDCERLLLDKKIRIDQK